PSGNFGTALATVGPNLAVGDPVDSRPGSGGSVSLFNGTTLALLRYVPAPTDNYAFGTAVADYGGNLLVGSPRGFRSPGAFLVDVNPGAVPASVRDPTRHPPIPPYELEFGSAVTAAGARVLIGAPGYDDPAGSTDEGSASVIDPFGSPGGALIFNLPNPGSSFSYFGSTLAVIGDRLLVGAPGFGTSSGAVHEFDVSSGALLHTILPPPGGQRTGRTLAVDASTLFASGSQVYRFAVDGTLLRTYSTPSGQSFDNYGNSLAVNGSLLLVGALGTRVGNLSPGAAYLFDVGSGTLLQTLPNPHPQSSFNFGERVAIVGKYLAITAFSDSWTVLVYAPCGDDVVDPIEVCDDGNVVDGDGCDSNCRPTGCGNGVVTTGEQCDDGNTLGGDGCRADCTIEACGDGI